MPVLNGNFKRNPEYYDKPWPYFEHEIQMLGTVRQLQEDSPTSSRARTHVMYWLFEEDRDQVAKARPDAKLFTNQFPGYSSRLVRPHQAVQRQTPAPGLQHGH